MRSEERIGQHEACLYQMRKNGQDAIRYPGSSSPCSRPLYAKTIEQTRAMAEAVIEHVAVDGLVTDLKVSKI
jgi:hypothetical protein